MAAIRLRRWAAHRGPRPEVAEGVLALPIGLLALFLACELTTAHRLPLDATSWAFTGVVIGFSVVLIYSSIRRSRGWKRRAMLACGIPGMIAAVIWALTVFGTIWRFRSAFI